MKKNLLFLLVVLTSSNVLAQKNFWTENTYEELNLKGTQYIYPEKFESYYLDYEEIKDYLFSAPLHEFNGNSLTSEIEIMLPLPDGSSEVFRIVESPVYDAVLAQKYPNIKTFLAYCPNHPNWYSRFDITPMGFHAMILGTENGTIFIDPTTHLGADINQYLVYYKNDFKTDKVFECHLETLESPSVQKSGISAAKFGDCQLRTYRLALAATGEYTAFHGGTVAGALAAQVTSMNRVNGVYEKDMSIHMNIVGNNDLIIYTNGGSDPYTNGNGGTMLGENQNNIDNVIGTANYDIGHVYSTGGGGIASLQSPCSSTRKAQGVTGQSSPIGDPFDIDYVAHEMGHQFGGNHTQNNNCNRNGATAMEPGSASTIMGYAGICAPNVQNNSDDYFHGITLEEIGDFITGGGHTCPIETGTGNSEPTVSYPSTTITIPANTPFALTAIASDPDVGDVLTYCWEQMDNNTATMPPVSTATGGPAFRSFDPTTDPTRYFPNLPDVIAGNSPTWEVLPSVSRDMDFRVVVRDNSAGAGCNDHTDITVEVDAGSGPFVVNNPSNSGITWTGNTTETVTWSVANTSSAPVSCSDVNILISYNGGVSFLDTLASDVANDGSQLITVPNTATTTAIVMVQCANGTFFDVSNNTFTISAITNDYTLEASPNSLTVCEGNNAIFTVDVDKVGVYNNNVALSVSGLPAGLTANFSTNNQAPVFNSNLTISNTAAVAGGTYNFSVVANSTSGSKTKNLSITIIENLSGAPSLTTPANASSGISTPINLTWSAITGANYQIDLATDASFSNIIETSSGIIGTSYTSGALAANTTFYWRVIASNTCDSQTSTTFSFTTANCISVASTDIPVAISNSGTPIITSDLVISGTSGAISDLNVVNLIGTHTYISDLIFVLTSPNGTIDTLLNTICNNQNNFDINLDDAAANNNYPCAPTDGGNYIPYSPLSIFNGENANGTWVLTVYDVFNQDGGSLNSWGLELCFSAVCSPATGTDNTTACDSAFVNGAWYLSSTSFNDTSVAGASSGCDSITTFNVTINNSYSTSQNLSACDMIVINGTTYSSSQVVMNSYTASNNCDSTHTINLTINPNTTGSENIITCDMAVINGTTYTASQIVTNTYTAANSCDSVHTVNLTINYSSTPTIINQTTCNPTNVGSNSVTLTNTANCDSVVTTNTTLIVGGSSTNNTVACDSAFVNGSWYFASTSFNQTFNGASANGCDSTVTFNITINNSYSTSQNLSACDMIVINGTTYSASQVVMNSYTASNNCDSTHTINLTINPSTTGSENIITCDMAVINGTTYTASQIVTNTYTAANSCDSVHTVNLTINYSSSPTIINQTTCNPTNVGSNSVTLTNTANCDSVVTTNTTLIVGGSSTNNTVACDSAFVNGSWYFASSSFNQTFNGASANGCDSTVTFNITINNSYSTSQNLSACDMIVINGTSYSSSQVVMNSYTASNNCDSTHTINLTINSSTTGSENITTCDMAVINGTTYTASQIVTNTYTAANSCDSVHTVNLTINYSSTPTIINQTTCNPTNVGSNSVTLTNTANCDSVVTTNTTLIVGGSSTNNTVSCDSAFVNGSWYFTSTSFNQTFNGASANGCDSTVTFNITINNSYSTSQNISACDVIMINGTNYSTSQVLTTTYSTTSNCDSTHTINLVINNSSPVTVLNQTSCNPADVGSSTVLLSNSSACDSLIITNTTLIAGGNGVVNINGCDSTFANGIWYFSSTSFNQTFSNASANGCDSTITYNVFVNNSSSGVSNLSGCDSAVFNGVTYYSSLIDTAIFAGSNTCDSTHITNITVYNVDTTIVQNNADLSANQLGASYQWIDCSNGNTPIFGEINSNYTATANGSYAVQITLNGCTYSSECISVTSIGIRDNELEAILSVYPNPTNGSFTLEFSENIQDLKASIYTIEGKLLLEESVSNTSSLPLVINASVGVYFLKVETNLGSTIIKVIKE